MILVNYSKQTLKTAIIFVVLILGLSNFASAQTASEREAKVKEYVKYLSSEDLEGREPGHPGNFKASEYILNMFKAIGLQPINGKFTSEFDITTGLKPGTKCSTVFTTLIERPGVPKEMWHPQERKWTVGEDYQPLSASRKDTVSGELIFAGFGITCEEKGYDDYAGIEASGKIAILLTDSPFDRKNDDLKRYRSLNYKIGNAINHGVRGIILVKVQGDSANVFFPLKQEHIAHSGDIVLVQANRTSIAKFFPRNISLLPLEQEIIKKETPKSFVIPNTKVAIDVDIEKLRTPVSNVFAMVKGTDAKLSDEYIVVGGHFDHLGWGAEGTLYTGKKPMIHYGADDNASGVSAFLDMARGIAQKPLRRSVIFVGFNCEEMGLLGSSAFVKNPPVPNEKIVFMLNLDMVGRLNSEKKLNILGVGTGKTLTAIIDSLALMDSVDITKAKEGIGPSDHTSFFLHKIPVSMFFTGVHGDYHRPTDTWDKLNYAGIVRISDFGEHLIRTIGNNTDRMEYVNQAFASMSDSTKQMKRGNGAWFGIVPNFEESESGFIISGTSDGSPAQKAGMLAGDVITKFGDAVIKNLYDLNSALSEKKPGDVVNVVFIRHGKEMSIEVKLTSRN
jgi:hypothetical protein